MIAAIRRWLAHFGRAIEIVAISNGGERVTHLYPNDCYYAHLSLYRFAAQFATGKRVLDAGSGTGYGTAYLATHGARQVVGVDLSADGVAFSRRHFWRPNLRFICQDVQELTGITPGSLDLICCSNVLEHLPSVPAFLHAVQMALARDGCLLVAVPPVIHDYSRTENLANPYHLNVWSPQQWYATMQQYFAECQCYQHVCTRQDVALNFANRPEETVVTEADFSFVPVTLDQWLAAPTMTFVLLARQPRGESSVPQATDAITFVDNSVTKPVVPVPATRMSVLAQRIHALALPPASRRWQLWTIAQRALVLGRRQGGRALIGKARTSLHRHLLARPTPRPE